MTDHQHGTDDQQPGADDHQPGTDDHHARDAESVAYSVLTISSSRTLDDDPGGDAVLAAIVDAGDAVVERDLVTDDEAAIRERVEAAVASDDVDAVVTTGGTGLSPDDVTPEAVGPLFDREIPGFGEEFRSRSVEAVGPHGTLSRATAGVADSVPVFCLPGSEQAASTGAAELVLPIAGHVVGLAGDAGDRDGHHEHGADDADDRDRHHEHGADDDHAHDQEGRE